MGRFYLSGGYQNSFYRLNLGDKSLKELKYMLTAHNYDGMIGIGNNIFIVSGYKNPNVEKYDLSTNSWALFNLQIIVFHIRNVYQLKIDFYIYLEDYVKVEIIKKYIEWI